MLRSFPLALALLAPQAVSSHPHIFVEARVQLHFAPDGGLTIGLDWEYDALFSLLVTSDFGLDPDGDLVLTAEETDRLQTEIAAWPEDFAGDLEVTQAGVLLPLAAKEDHRMTYAAGIFTETHLRPLTGPVDLAAPLQIRVYDPTYYTAYSLDQRVTISGRDDCSAVILPADLDAAYALARELTGRIDFSSDDPAAVFPEIGAAFADTIVVQCSPRG